ncbi:uncharacterized protein DUF4167 [Maritimibacter alkaliphilus HTCC2654]|uniref:DUF4167 domain-containing protein n=1 Tax=Maritimibacter alkaliphilus HTCC2654 TaxID=314271 RepID=A3VJP2_9RHOB|nr:DUF4167 domain-containing protein [Maritimibacter alkaliphilus]EAQ11619.1 hypothetical protein RB2654_04289 [Rhodobacterales bacterium HTCC2654] [Maritimibacter alkaliphilus HTCC2654]TYP81436.1 uncharacterized protein DUF4167 [Maritimibacter alkaliphilus HTCC2654]
MRSSKSRSRGKNNRNRSPSNNINRVFDSSGPEGKVRGTPQQIIDKYTQLSRDAFLGNDRVAGENFQQHAEHYARLLSEAQKDAEAKRQQNQPQQGGNSGGNGQNDNQSNGNNDGNGNNQRKNRDAQRREEKQNRDRSNDNYDPGSSPQPDVIETAQDDDNGLVETPENAQKADDTHAEKPKKPRAPRKPRAKKPEGDMAEATQGASDGSTPEAAE